MSKLTNADQPANPTVHTTAHLNGLTKREQFAAMAMQGLLSTPVKAGVTEEDVCILSVRAADALLEALEATK